jgi:hypothetical protein
VIQQSIPAPPPGAAPVPVWSAFGADIVTRAAQGALVLGFLPVVPMTIVSALLMWGVSRATASALPGEATLRRYF